MTVVERRAYKAAAARAYRLKYPRRQLIARLRAARNLLERYGFDVNGGAVDLNNIRSLEGDDDDGTDNSR